MKAIVFSQTGGPEVLALSDVPTPDVRPGMVRSKVHAVGVNFDLAWPGTDEAARVGYRAVSHAR